jgi:hypothetical protein
MVETIEYLMPYDARKVEIDPSAAKRAVIE